MEEFGRNLMEKAGIDADLFDFSAEAMTRMHIINIIVGVVMMAIGGILLFKIRKQKDDGGKRIAGWILLGLGIATTVAHIIQMIMVLV